MKRFFRSRDQGLAAKLLTGRKRGISCGESFIPVFFSRNQHRLVIASLSLLVLSALAAPVVQPEAKSAVFNVDGFQEVGFDQLASFEFTPPTYDTVGANGQPVVKKGGEQIPERIKALDAKKVVVTGFMLPIKMNEGLVTEFLLVKDPMMCCYGIMPKINEWVIVRMLGKGVAPLMDVPISFEGKLKVGELYDNGYLTGIYLLEGEKQAKGKG